MKMINKIILGSVIALTMNGCYHHGGPVIHNPIARGIVGGAIAGGAGAALGVLTSPYGYYNRGLPVAYGHTAYRPYYQNNFRQTGCYYRGAYNPPECPQRVVAPVIRRNPKDVTNAELLRAYD